MADADLPSFHGIIGRSAAMQALFRRMEKFARRDVSVLIQGETGTGKGLIARAIHRSGPRSAGPFVDVNCAAIPETLLEAELFGFERGAFTDARQAKPGLFQAAHGGTLFLDEAGLLPEALQAKLLTVLEERTVRRLGSTRSEPVDVWILAATSEDLLAAIRGRRFREDLYHRLSVLTLSLPPLRERGEDVVRLAERFLARACTDYGLPQKAFVPDALAALRAYAWPGNIRELANVMERVALLSDSPTVSAEMLGLPGPPASRPDPGPREAAAASLGDTLEGVERQHLLEALRETGGNSSRAATRLGIPRNTLRYRMEKHGLRPGGPPTASAQEAPAPAAPSVPPPPGPSAGPPAPSGIRWERRRLTVLRAELIPRPGATAAVDLGRPLEVIMQKAEGFGGRIEEVSPTGLVAVFGLEPIEDAPQQAAHAAMAIQKAAERAGIGYAERPAFKVAIHAAQLMVGRVGGAAQIDASAKPAVWTALEALVQHAVPDTILVSPAAAQFLERRFELVPAAGGLPAALEPAKQLAGRERPGLRRRLNRFVGRGHELELLGSRLASVIHGHGQVVGIGGEAGIGKSRLLLEFRQGLERQQVAYLEGRCLPYGSATPYLPVLDLLRMGCRIGETDSPATITQKVRAGLDLVGMEAEEGIPYLLELLGVKEGTEPLAALSAEAINVRTTELLRQASLKSSRRRPLVLAVEDAHWIDSASEAYLGSLIDSLAGAAILLLLTYRPGYRPPWLDKSFVTQIALQPLAPEESLTVVQSVLPAERLPDPLVRRMLDKADGNPFFLEELARAVAEQGPLSTLPVPDTIQEVLLSRIDRLPDAPRALLQTASVLGREVPGRLLGAIWEGPGAPDALLRELMKFEFLYEQDGGEDAVHVFTHALTQEVAYESLPLARRQTLHEAAGRALERLYGNRLEEVYDRLAHHYSKTRQAAKAVEYLSRFAERAARTYAHAEAAATLQEALLHAEELPADERDDRLIDLALRQAHSLCLLGRFSEVLDLLARVKDRLERLKAPALAGPYYFWLGYTYSHLGDQERAAQSAQSALEAARLGPDERTMGQAYLLLAQESSWSGEPLRGIEHGRLAVDRLERAGERWWLGLAHWVVGVNYITIGSFQPALEAEARAQAIGAALGDPRIQSYATWTTGWIHALMGECDLGIAACRQGLVYSLDPVNTAVAAAHLGYAYLEQGDFDQAIPLPEQAVARIGEFRFRRLQGRFLAFLGEAYLLKGELDRARELVSQGLSLNRDAKYRYGLGWAELAMGRIARARGDLVEAEAQLNAALKTFLSIEARYMTGRTHLALAEVAHDRHDGEGTAGHLREACGLFHVLQVPRYEERTRRRASEFGVSLPAEAPG